MGDGKYRSQVYVTGRRRCVFPVVALRVGADLAAGEINIQVVVGLQGVCERIGLRPSPLCTTTNQDTGIAPKLISWALDY